MKLRSELVKFTFLSFLGCWFLLLVIMLATTEHQNLFTNIDKSGAVGVSDFLHYYQAAVTTLSDQRYHVYEPAVQLADMNKIISPRHIEKAFYFQGVPYTFPIVAPLGLMSPEMAYAVWSLLSIICCCIGVHFINRLRPTKERFDKTDLGIIILGMLSSAAGILTLKLGQFSLFLTGIYCFYFWALRNKKSVLAGLMIALSTFKPQYAVLMGIPIIGLKQWKTLAFAVFFEIIQLVAAGLTIGWDNIWNYPKYLKLAETDPNVVGAVPGQMVSLRNLLDIFGNQEITLIVNSICIFAAAIGLLYIWHRTATSLARVDSSVNLSADDDLNRQSNVDYAERLFNWSCSITLALAVTLSPHAHIYDLDVLSIVALLSLPTWSGLKNILTNLLLSNRVLSNRVLPNQGVKQFDLSIWSVILLTFPCVSWLLFAAPVAYNTKGIALLLVLLAICGIIHVNDLLRRKVISEPGL